jgi:hypothetical protein
MGWKLTYEFTVKLTNPSSFIYVLIFGRDIPWWVYGVIAILIGQGVLSLMMKLRRTPVRGEKER